jgi:hydrogenase expression/formation protein HypC
MCLAIPGRVIDIADDRLARVDFGGIVRRASLELTPEAAPGDYVMVHVGYAISKVDAEEAEGAYRLLEAMGLLDEAPP